MEIVNTGLKGSRKITKVKIKKVTGVYRIPVNRVGILEGAINRIQQSQNDSILINRAILRGNRIKRIGDDCNE